MIGPCKTCGLHYCRGREFLGGVDLEDSPFEVVNLLCRTLCCLDGLVRCQESKQRHGKAAGYQERRDFLWEQARRILHR